MTTERKIAVVGDWVECIHQDPCGDQFHEGGTYLVTAVYQDYGEIRYSFDLDDLGSKTNGWVAKYFTLICHGNNERSPMNQGEYEAILADQDAYEALKED